MESISVFDMFKIGVGPSSSHTMGPWKASMLFLESLMDALDHTESIHVKLFGSLALTGKGHGSDKAIILGLSGFDPISIEPQPIEQVVAQVLYDHVLMLAGKRQIRFEAKAAIAYYKNESLDFHSNAMILEARDKSGDLVLAETYYSIGGGFVVKEGETMEGSQSAIPYPSESAKETRENCNKSGLDIASVSFANELFWRDEITVKKNLLQIWDVMSDAVYRGCHTEGTLPGGLNVTRRAAQMHNRLLGEQGPFDTKSEWIAHLKEMGTSFEKTLKFVSCFAIATNEENACFGKVVTAPTNGSAGVIPAVLLYFICFNEHKETCDHDIIDFLCVAGEIGSIFKKEATISAAMGGCQAEIGVSSAMAAAALTSGLGGSVDQSLMAAEIAMEHHLGLTCDPVNGLVQIPCIERNSMGAIKAITAAQIALESQPELAKVSLDEVIKTMWKTAQDMNVKYKETSLGGLAESVSVSLSEC
ncbi:MAG: L-serine ammonia-lyase [Cyclobacteriaceae bacterium]